MIDVQHASFDPMTLSVPHRRRLVHAPRSACPRTRMRLDATCPVSVRETSVHWHLIIYALQPALDLLQEASGGQAVEDPVVDAEREVHHRADRDHLADHDRALD